MLIIQTQTEATHCEWIDQEQALRIPLCREPAFTRLRRERHRNGELQASVEYAYCHDHVREERRMERTWYIGSAYRVAEFIKDDRLKEQITRAEAGDMRDYQAIRAIVDVNIHFIGGRHPWE